MKKRSSSIGPPTSDRVRYGITSKKGGRFRKIALVLALVVVLVIDFGLLVADVHMRRWSVDQHGKRPKHSNVMLLPPSGSSAQSVRHHQSI